MDQGPDVVRVAPQGSGALPLLVGLIQAGRDELELDHAALRRARQQAALVLPTTHSEAQHDATHQQSVVANEVIHRSGK